MGQPGEPMRDEWVTVDDRPMYVRVGGDQHQGETPVVLAHGLALSGSYMLPTAVRLASDRPTYLPDLPGFGQSAKPSHILNVPEMADALAGCMRARGLSKVCLVGNSLGCQYGADLALRYPELVSSLVLIGPTDTSAPTFAQQAVRGFRDLLGEPWSFWPLLAYDYVTTPVRTMVSLRHALNDPFFEKLSGIETPTLVVRGSRDPIAPQEWVEALVRRLPKGRLLVIPGATHVANYTAADAVAQVVRDFIREAASGPAALCAVQGDRHD